jgi:hypothetical protein
MQSPKALAVIFKQIREGDIRKIAAESNDAPTGGGAQDLRFPALPFANVFGLYFPNVVRYSENGGEIRRGTMVWRNKNAIDNQYKVELHPPTNARPREARIARIDDLPPMQACPDPSELDPVFVIFTLDGNGTFRCDFARVSDLHASWHHEVSSPILRSLEAIRGKKSACGFIDFKNGREYLHT